MSQYYEHKDYMCNSIHAYLLSNSVVKKPPANARDAGDSGSVPGLGRSPGEEMATLSSILVWRIPDKGSGKLQSMQSQRVRHDWASTHTYTEITLYSICLIIVTFNDLPTGGSAGEGSACNVWDLGLIPRLGRSPGEENSYPLQYSRLEYYMNCIVHGVAKSRTQLSGFHFHFIIVSTFGLLPL